MQLQFLPADLCLDYQVGCWQGANYRVYLPAAPSSSLCLLPLYPCISWWIISRRNISQRNMSYLVLSLYLCHNKEFDLDFYPIVDNSHETAASIMSLTSLSHKWGSSAVDLSGQQSMLAIACLRLPLPSQLDQLTSMSELENLATLFFGQCVVCQQQLALGYVSIPSQVYLLGGSPNYQELKQRCNQCSAVEHASNSWPQATPSRLAAALALLPPGAHIYMEGDISQMFSSPEFYFTLQCIAWELH